MEAFFSPLQFGVGTKQGAETIVYAHAVKLAIEEHPEWVLFQTDFKNAYNSVTRRNALEAVRRHFPTMHPWMSKIYAHKSQLRIDGAGEQEHIYSKEGVQQGDPLLSARGGIALGYNDDITGVAPGEAVAEYLQVIGDAAAEVLGVLFCRKCDRRSTCGSPACR